MNTAQSDLAAPIDPLIRDKEAASIMRISTPTFWRRVKDGTVPSPIKLGGMSRWSRSEIIEIVERLKITRGKAA
ncbi:DNA-binding protein [bacterium]|nr:DNA-binding protein [bacterium]